MSWRELKQLANELQAMDSDDPQVLNDLSAVYWRLNRQEQAVAAFEVLLRHAEPFMDEEFDSIYLEGLRVNWESRLS